MNKSEEECLMCKVKGKNVEWTSHCLYCFLRIQKINTKLFSQPHAILSSYRQTLDQCNSLQSQLYEIKKELLEKIDILENFTRHCDKE